MHHVPEGDGGVAVDVTIPDDENSLRVLNIDPRSRGGIDVPTLDNEWVRRRTIPGHNPVGRRELVVAIDGYGLMRCEDSLRVSGAKCWKNEASCQERTRNQAHSQNVFSTLQGTPCY